MFEQQKVLNVCLEVVDRDPAVRPDHREQLSYGFAFDNVTTDFGDGCPASGDFEVGIPRKKERKYPFE
jgi:hypothetical protein